MQRSGGVYNHIGMLPVALGATVAFFAVVTILGWLIGRPGLLELLPGTTPMPLYTAVAFVLAGMGLWAANKKRQLWVIFVSLALLFLSLLTWVDFIFDLSLKDTALLFHFRDDQGNLINELMRPNAALLFLLIAIALMCLRTPSSAWRRSVAVIFGSLIAAFASSAFIGYALNAGNMQGWGALTSIAEHASLGLLLLGIAIVTQAWIEEREHGWPTLGWVPILCAGIVAAFILWYELKAEQESFVLQMVEAEGLDVVGDALSEIDDIGYALERMAGRWDTRNGTPLEEWASQAEANVRTHAGLVAMAWAKGEEDPFWLALDTAQQSPDRDWILNSPDLLEAIQSVRQSPRSLLTQIEGLEAERVKAIRIEPVYDERQVSGILIGVISLAELMDSVVEDLQTRGYEIVVKIGEREVYRYGNPEHWTTAAAHRELVFAPFGHEWVIDIAPSQELGSVLQTRRPETTFVIVLLVSVLLSVLYHMTANMARHAGEIAKANTRLEREIGERRAAQEALSHTAEELKRANVDLRNFAHVASHDLKAPLRGISNLAQWIEDDLGPALAGEPKEHMALLRRRISRLERLLDDLLSYAAAGRAERSVEEVDTGRLIEDIREYLALPEEFKISCATKMPILATDRPALEQIFRNLITNAVKHHDRDGGEVTISAKETGNMYLFTVADDGPGIASEFHERIFRMFTTLKPRDEVEGSGMGLAILRRLLRHAGGEIWVESSADRRGTLFHFTWPHQGSSVRAA